MSIPASSETAVPGSKVEIYRPVARLFHWLTVLLLVMQFPVGLYMVYRGPGQNIWDTTTNTLYAGHKVVGVVILTLVVLRLLYRLAAGTPAPEPTLESWHKIVGALNHWSMYLLLLIVPTLGYLAICYFPALNIVGDFAFPAVVAPDRGLYDRVIGWHATAAGVLASLIGLHVAAALYHRLIRHDKVFTRMLPGLRD